MNENPYLANPYLNKFGELLMTEVRDQTIWLVDNILAGNINTTQSRMASTVVATLDDKQKELVDWLVPTIVDKSLHYLLYAFEQYDPEVAVIQYIAENDGKNVIEISDGLAGEVYGSDGWIARFSKERRYEDYPGSKS